MDAMEVPSATPDMPAAPAWRSVITRALRVCEAVLWMVFFAFALCVILLRYAILPNAERYRPEVESVLSKALGSRVAIGGIEAGWDGLYPDLDLSDVRVFDRQGRPALSLPFVSLTLSWWSVPAREVRLHALEITGADLDIRRTRAGTLVIGGIEVVDAPDGASVSDWILGQRRIVIADSRLRWNDEKRAAPELALSNIRTVIENAGKRHRLGFTADPPKALASRIDIRADLNGGSLGRLAEWRGSVYADLKFIDLAAWRSWVDYPADVRAGTGRVRAWLGFDADHLEYFTADVGLADAQARLARDLPVLELARVSGRVGVKEVASGGKALGFLRFGEKQVTGFEAGGQQISLMTKAGVSLAPADFSMRSIGARGDRPQEIELIANSLDLEPLANLLEHLPVDGALRQLLAETNPRGSVFDFRMSWRGDFEKPVGYSARGRFSELSMDARGPLPGFSNFSGSVVATDKGGTLTLVTKNASILLPQLFDEPKVGLDQATGLVAWSFPKGKFEVRSDNLAFANPDAAVSAQVLYRTEPDAPGYMELEAKLVRGVGPRAHRYLPKHLSDTRAWLVGAIEKGRVEEGSFLLKGNLADFPFDDPRRGNFRIVLKLADTSLLYASGWPVIENARGELIFDRSGLEFKGNAPGNIGPLKLGRVEAKIANLMVTSPVLEIQGAADGPVQSFLQFIDQSPVDRMIDGYTDGMKASGAGKLNLRMSMPIAEIAKTRLSGQFQFSNNDIRLDEDLPVLGRVNGALAFTESGLTLRGLRGEALGGAFTLSGASRADGVISVNASGNFTVPGLRSWLNDPLLSAMSGGAAWRATINARRKSGDVSIESNLAGVAVDLPAPLGKAAAEAASFRLAKAQVQGAKDEEEWNLAYGHALNARIARRLDRGSMVFARGAVGVGDIMPTLPRSGLALNVAAGAIDVEAWKSRLFDARGAGGGASSAGLPAEFQPLQARVRSDVIDAFGKRLTQVRMDIAQEGANWTAAITSQEVNGSVIFQPGRGRDAGRLTARLKSLFIPANVATQEPRADSPVDRITQELPGVDLAVESFEVADKKLGKLELLASNAGNEWRIQRLNLANPDGVLAGSGAWRARRAGEARRRLALDFGIEAYDAGKLLERLGFPGTLRAGSGRLEGAASWEGSPLAIDYPTLTGTISLRVEKGQFLKADPGVGKLLGIMSLQALPRRLALDFRDVFSEGFAFDLVSASSRIERGILSTSDFKMTGVSAAVLMNGEVDLVKETQGLRVVVLPDLSGGMGSVVTALLGNPILGIATYLAQRVLKDPLSKAFSFEYVVGGTWADPKVARIQNTQLEQAGAASGNEAGAPGEAPRSAQGRIGEEGRK
jgi:uncharacterized protein (TIGR02099 family)